MVIFSPVIIITAIVIKLTSPGPVLVEKESLHMKRMGKGEKTFRLYKFRSMMVGADILLKRDPKFRKAKKERHTRGNYKIVNDPRVTPIGKITRKYSIDEMPQLYNVLKGEMCLVGPRPARMDQIEKFSQEERRRMLVKPGLTGWAQINGRNLLSWKDRIKLDLWYVEHETFGLNLKILFKTVWVAFVSKNGNYGPEGVTRDYGA